MQANPEASRNLWFFNDIMFCSLQVKLEKQEELITDTQQVLAAAQTEVQNLKMQLDNVTREKVNHLTCTRMRFSRVHTVRCSGRRGCGVCIPACTGQGGVSQHALGRGLYIPACTGQGGVCISAYTGRGCLPRGCLLGGVCLVGGGVCPGRGCLSNEG